MILFGKMARGTQCKMQVTAPNGTLILDRSYDLCDGCVFTKTLLYYPYYDLPNGTYFARVKVDGSMEDPKIRSFNSNTCLIVHGSVDDWKFDYFDQNSEFCNTSSVEICSNIH